MNQQPACPCSDQVWLTSNEASTKVSQDITGYSRGTCQETHPFHSFPFRPIVSESCRCQEAQLVSVWHTLALLNRMDLKRGRKERAERIDAIDA